MSRIIGYKIIKSYENVENWMFLEIRTDSGFSGVGEISSSPLNADKVAALMDKVMSVCLCNDNDFDYHDIIGLFSFSNCSIVESTVISGISQAIMDVKAKENGLPLYKYLGGNSGSVRLYANLNRALRHNRDNTILHQRIKDARRRGFAKIKIAPFDALTPEMKLEDTKKEFELVRYRINMALDVMGENNVAIDCHQRCSLQTMDLLFDSLIFDSLAVEYIEDVLDYSSENNLLLKDKRRSIPFKIAGGEFCFNPQELARVLEDDVFDIMNPDIKFIGTLQDYIKSYAVMKNRGICVRPHNPTSPISTAFSAAVISAMNDDTELEFAFGCQELRDFLVGECEDVDNGRYYLSDKSGIGVSLSEKFKKEYCFYYKDGSWEKCRG